MAEELKATTTLPNESTEHFNESTSSGHGSVSDIPALLDTSDESISSRKRSKSPEEVTHPNEEKGAAFRGSKRTKAELLKGKINKNQRNTLPKNQKGQSSSKHKGITSNQNINSNQSLKMPTYNASESKCALTVSNIQKDCAGIMPSVPNWTEIPIVASSSETSTNSGSFVADNVPETSNMNREEIKKSKKELPKCRVGDGSTAESTSSTSIQDVPTDNQEQFEEELKCSICSEIFINAVTLNCSHSFCQYCIATWRREHSTCPICRQTITSQNATLVLDKCVERVLLSSKEETKKHRNEVIDYREKNKQPDPDPQQIRNMNNNFFHDGDSTDEDDNLDFFEDPYDDDDVDEYFDEDYDEDFYDHDDQFFDEEDEYDPDVAEEDAVEEEQQEEDEEEEEEAEDDNYDEEDSYYEDSESNIEEEESPINEEQEEEEEEEESDWDDNRCYNCGEEGHYARNCPTGVAYTGIAGAFYGGYGSCFKCNQEGHWANGCPY